MGATVYAVAMGKGGVGKTTVAAELLAWMWMSQRRPLGIDLDEQHHLTGRMGLTKDSPINGEVWDVLANGATFAEVATPSPILPSVDVIVSTHRLTQVDDLPRADVHSALTSRRAELDAWDVVVCDLPPSLRATAIAGLAAADVVVAVCEVAPESIEELPRLEAVARSLGKRLDFIIPMKYERTTLNGRDGIAELQDVWGDRLTPPIRRSTAVPDAYRARLPTLLWAPTSAVADDIRAAMQCITDGEPA